MCEKNKNIASKVKLELFYANDFNRNESHDAVIQKMANLSLFESTEKKINNSNGFIVSGVEFFVPFGDSIDVEAETKQNKNFDYSRGFLTSVLKRNFQMSVLSILLLKHSGHGAKKRIGRTH